MAESFGCCSSYVECSNAGHCIHPDYTGCFYRKNLEAGNIFYGNAGKSQKPKSIPNWMKPEYHIYLTCYNQPFAILARNKVGLSYGLKEESFTKLKNLFDVLEIPYITDLSKGDFKNSELIENREIKDSRVVIEVGDDKYNILNFDSLLLVKNKCDGIRKAFETKGILARVEKIGRWSAVDIPPFMATKKLIAVSVGKVVEPEPVVVEEKEITYEQPSIFDLMGV